MTDAPPCKVALWPLPVLSKPSSTKARSASTPATLASGVAMSAATSAADRATVHKRTDAISPSVYRFKVPPPTCRSCPLSVSDNTRPEQFDAFPCSAPSK